VILSGLELGQSGAESLVKIRMSICHHACHLRWFIPVEEGGGVEL
jgi:hypothetical protein